MSAQKGIDKLYKHITRYDGAATAVSVIVMVFDLFIVGMIIACAWYNLILGIMVFLFMHSAQKDNGGWFFAWKKKNRQKFHDNFT